MKKHFHPNVRYHRAVLTQNLVEWECFSCDMGRKKAKKWNRASFMSSKCTHTHILYMGKGPGLGGGYIWALLELQKYANWFKGHIPMGDSIVEFETRPACISFLTAIGPMCTVPSSTRATPQPTMTSSLSPRPWTSVYMWSSFSFSGVSYLSLVLKACGPRSSYP